MRHSEFVSIDNIINAREYTKIVDILKEYSLEPIKIERVRSVYKVTTNGRIYCLKKMKHGGDEKVEKGMLLSKYLVGKGFYNVIRYIKTSNNKLCVKRGHYIYYVTDWIKGRECDFEDYEELKHCAALLAEFHEKSAGFAIDSSKMDSNIKKWPTIFKKEKNDLNVIRDIINSKKVKTPFDLNYLALIDEYLDKMDMSIKLLDDSSYIEISNKANQSKSVCHDSFYYQNIIIKNNNKMYLIDLDSSIYDMNVYDLAKFIRRILFISKYSWSFDVAKELIETYSNVIPLTMEEIELLLAFIIFPHKFWKLGKKRYIARKDWVEAKFIRRLNKILKYKDMENIFIEQYYDYFLKKEIKKEE